MKQIIRNKELAKILKEYSSAYHAYEFEDFLEILAAVIPQLVAEDKTVKILDLGDFIPKHVKDKTMYSPLTGLTTEIKGGINLAFKPSPSVNKKVRERSQQNGND